MSDLKDPTENQLDEGNSPLQGVINRLLGRKHASGVVLPKIRNKISRIKNNSDLIRKNRLDLPGHARREQYKSFGTKLLEKQTRTGKVGKKSIANTQSGRWDQLDMSLPNGVQTEGARTNVFRPEIGDLGIPAGGQVIPPFSLPVSSDGPSFIERRQERLKNQESKKSKPVANKPDKPTRLYSRVEEILPSNLEKPAEALPTNQNFIEEKEAQPEGKKTLPQQKASPQPKTHQEKVKFSEKDITPKNQPITQKTEPTRTESKEKTTIEKLPGSILEKNVVQRQLDKEADRKIRPAEKNLIPEQFPILDNRKVDASQPSIKNMEDELNTLASKPSIPPINDGDQKKQGDTFKKIEKIKSSSKSSVINHEKKDIKEELKNSPQKPSASAAKEEERDISPESPNEKIKKTSEKEEQKEAPSSKGRPDIASPSPKMVQREIDHEIKPDLSVTTQPVVDVKDHKLDLPLVHKKASQEADDKSLTEKPMSEKVTGKFAEKEPEKDLSLKKKSKQFGKESPKITQEKPEFQAKKSAIEVIKQSRPKKTIIFSPSQNIEKPKSKYILPLIKKFDKKSGFDELITPTAKNVIQRQPENKVDKFPEKDDFTQSGDSLDEKFRPVVQTLQTSKQTKKPEQKKLIVKKTDGLETPRRHLTIQQTPLSRKITQKFLDKKNINPSPIKIQTVRKDSFPIIMRSVGKVNDKPTEDFSIEETYDNRIVPGKKKPDYTSKPQQGNKKTINAESIADKLLVTQLGRKTIQKSLPKNNAIDVSQANEPILEQKYSTSKASLFNQNSQPTGFLKQKKLSGFQQGSNEEKTVKKFPKNRSVSETKYVTQKFEKKLTPLKEELPVVQMKKTISSEPTFHPELAVQGPVVQRIIEPELESIQPVDDPNVVKLDLSKLARDVYPIIKRWMAVEKERTSGRL